MRIIGAGTAFPPHYYDQETLIAAFREHWAERHFNLDRLEQLHRNVLVGGRHLALPLDEYPKLEGWGASNDAWIRVAQDVGAEAITRALKSAEFHPSDVDALVFTTVTGLATPSIDARLVNRLGLPRRVVRMPLFGLGCVGGAAGLARAADVVRAHPDSVAVLLSVELCSLTLQRRDLSIPNLISSGLFGDGAAAIVIAGAERGGQGPRVIGTRSQLYPGTERVMGWDISEDGFKVVLSGEVPTVVRRYLRTDVDSFLSEHGLTRDDIALWLAHPGGPKVLEAMTECLELDEAALERAWRTLREVGNLSSTSVLLVLAEALAEPPPAGSYGVLMAMGPGFCSEQVLVQW
jgi:alkylresorcinol/alkylpyrone synthase